MFESDVEVLEWYEKQPRALSREFVSNICWHEIKNYELKPAFAPVLTYMRDVEYLTDMYYNELLRTPTGRDPVIRKFMDRWSIEELHHGNLLNRFLEEAGFNPSKTWQDDTNRSVPRGYRIGSYLIDRATRPFGRHFHGAHMVWGAINEITAMQSYRQLGELSGHPVLKQLLSGLIQEESIHASFYFNVARVKLAETKFSRDLARFIIGRFWSPVGQGPKTLNETKYVMSTLFHGQHGLELFREKIGKRIQRLPGFAGFDGLLQRIIPIVQTEAAG